MAKSPAVSTKTYILELKNGNTRKITIPSNWKMTYGQLVPHAERGQGGGVALRLYEGNKENLRAVMSDVVAIRDSSISIVEKRTSVQRKAAKKQTHQGMKDVVVEARVTEWVDPDAEDEGETPAEFLALPKSADEDDF